MSTRKIALINEKGGTCKTTIAVHLATWLARFKNKKVLLVDLDAQGQAGKSLGIDIRNLKHSVAELLSGECKAPTKAIVHSYIEKLDVLPSNKKLAQFPMIAGPQKRWKIRLSNIIKKLSNYDYIIFDSPPSLGIISENIMLAANEIVVPVGLTYFALDGCAEILDTIETLKEEYPEHDLKLSAVIPALYRPTKLADEILKKLRQYFPNAMTHQILNYNVKIDEAQSFGQDIWRYSPSSKGAMMLKNISAEIINKGKGRKKR